jgi:hypothetical protein
VICVGGASHAAGDEAHANASTNAHRIFAFQVTETLPKHHEWNMVGAAFRPPRAS